MSKPNQKPSEKKKHIWFTHRFGYETDSDGVTYCLDCGVVWNMRNDTANCKGKTKMRKLEVL